MKSNLKQIRKKRSYSEEFKKNLVASFEKGEFSVPQLEKLFGVCNANIYNWVYKYSTFNEKGCRIVEMKDSNESKLKELAKKVKDLEQIVGQKQIAIEYLEKMIELAKTDLNIDIKKLQFATISWFKSNKEKIAFSMSQLYKYVGITRQAINQYCQRQGAFDNRVLCLLSEVEELRKEHPGCGVEKMYYSLNPDFIGRDRFIELFMDLGFRLKKRMNYKRTTYAVASKYKNLIKGLSVSAPSVIWQSDITYYDISDKFYYVVFIIDVYTKIIVGYTVSDNMRATANVKAMEMALVNYKAPLIHHSDRGGQYIYNEYISLLEDNKCKISMCKSSQDNAYAERINRTIKEEYLDYWKPSDFKQLKKDTKRAVENYNNKRLHNNLDRIKPTAFAQNWKKQQKEERKTIIIFNNETV